MIRSVEKIIKLPKPETKKFSMTEILGDCVATMRNGDVKSRILNSKQEIIDGENKYDEKAQNKQLFEIQPTDTLEGGALKKDMIDLYERKFAKKGERARKYYDALIMNTKYDKCPYCAQRDVKTLDHYLPKTRYPVFAILPYNLIPSCMECNKVKLNEVASTREDEPIHPYYDDFCSDTWISAKMIEGEPIAFEFYVNCPSCWDDEKRKRAEKHFSNFELNKLYQPYASEEFTVLYKRILLLYHLGGKALAMQMLEADILGYDENRLNTWQSAMYRAVKESDWFWDVHISREM